MNSDDPAEHSSSNQRYNSSDVNSFTDEGASVRDNLAEQSVEGNRSGQGLSETPSPFEQSSNHSAKPAIAKNRRIIEDNHSSGESTSDGSFYTHAVPLKVSDESIDYYDRLVELYNLESVVRWIAFHKFEKVRLSIT